MKRYPSVDPVDFGFGQDVVNVSETGADLSYLLSRAVGYAAPVVCAAFVAANLF